jgi:O-antigen/teichoic acid export membrane protein
LLHLGDVAALAREFDVCRRLTIGCTALTIGGVLVLAPLLLPLLGNYMGARSLMVLLAIPAFIQSFYATSDRLLIIAGHANVALLVTALSFALLAATPFATAPWFGSAAIPVAMILSVLVVGPIVVVRARQLVNIRSVAWRDIAFMACGIGALAGAAAAGTYASAVLACGLIGVIGVYYAMTATARSAADDYDSSVVVGAGASAAPPLSPARKAST